MCPHGHPIPAADGSFVDVDGHALVRRCDGLLGPVLSVAEDDEKILGYLGELGLRPGRARPRLWMLRHSKDR